MKSICHQGRYDLSLLPGLLAALLTMHAMVNTVAANVNDHPPGVPVQFDGAASGFEKISILAFSDLPVEAGASIQFDGLMANNGIGAPPKINVLTNFQYMEYDNSGRTVFRVNLPTLNVHSRQIAINQFEVVILRSIRGVFDVYQTRWFGSLTVTVDRADYMDESADDFLESEPGLHVGRRIIENESDPDYGSVWENEPTGCDGDYGDTDTESHYDEFSGCEGDDLETVDSDSSLDGDHCDGDAIAMVGGRRRRAPWATRLINWIPYMAIFFAIFGLRRRRSI
jgi:hypothetical protein